MVRPEIGGEDSSDPTQSVSRTRTDARGCAIGIVRAVTISVSSGAWVMTWAQPWRDEPELVEQGVHPRTIAVAIVSVGVLVAAAPLSRGSRAVAVAAFGVVTLGIWALQGRL